MVDQFVYVRLSGITSSYKVPALIDGIQLNLVVPGYSSILGMISYAAGREITTKDTRVGYKYTYKDNGLDLEKFHRFKRNDTGSYSYKNTDIRQREFHHNVSLELILDNLDLFEIIDSPSRQLTFGRSQDLASVNEVSIVTGEKIEKAILHGTLLPVKIGDPLPGNGIFQNLPENFDYKKGKVRKAMNSRTFIALDQHPQNIEFSDLYRINHNDIQSDFYLHQWN